MRTLRTSWLLLIALAAGQGCNRADKPLAVFTAGSLARPIRAALDTFANESGIRYELEAAGSLETARKLTELGKIPDVIALADEDVFAQLLVPRFTTWYARFARNRMVIAYTDRSRHAATMSEATWRDVLTRPDVEVGRSNPDLDPAGYRTLLVFQLAERHYSDSGLARRLEASAPRRNMRPKEAELVALLDAGELDYAWQYQSLARSSGHRYVTLPSSIDLSATGDSAAYAVASIRVLGAEPGDTISMTGRPISYAISIPTNAANRSAAERFVQWLLGPRGRAVMRSQFLDALDEPQYTGTGIPPAVKLPE